MTMQNESKTDAEARYRAFSENPHIQSVVHARLKNHGEPVDEEGILEYVRQTGKAEAEYIRSVLNK